MCALVHDKLFFTCYFQNSFYLCWQRGYVSVWHNVSQYGLDYNVSLCRFLWVHLFWGSLASWVWMSPDLGSLHPLFLWISFLVLSLFPSGSAIMHILWSICWCPIKSYAFFTLFHSFSFLPLWIISITCLQVCWFFLVLFLLLNSTEFFSSVIVFFSSKISAWLFCLVEILTLLTHCSPELIEHFCGGCLKFSVK